MATIITYTANSIHAVKNHVLVKGMEFNERITTSGIIIPSDNGKSSGIKPRWAEVVAVGPKQKDIKVGEWVLVDHGRWTRGISIIVDGETIELRRVDINDIFLVDDRYHNNDSLSDALSGDNNTHRINGSMHNSDGGGLTG